MDILTDRSMAAPANTGLVVMLKAPANAKRRLAAKAGGLAEEAAAHLLACALEDAFAWPGPTWLSPADPRDRDWLLSGIGAKTIPAAAPLPRMAACGGPDDSTDDIARARGSVPGSASAACKAHDVILARDSVSGNSVPDDKADDANVAWDSVSAGTAPDGMANDFTDDVPATNHGEICGLILQQGGNLGERINYVDSEVRRGRGRVDRLVFIGTDCPGLDADYLEQAALGLQRADAVLGPAGDGGVVLMGARRTWPDLGGLSWSTQGLFAELRGVCREAGWSVATLDAREDVDTLQDLVRADTAFSSDRRRSRRAFTEWLRARRGALLARQFDRRVNLRGETASRLDGRSLRTASPIRAGE